METMGDDYMMNYQLTILADNACEVVGITTDAAGIIVFGNKLLGAVGRYVEKNLLDSLLIVFHIIMMVCVL